MTQRNLMWGAAALLGIVATAAIAWSASQLARQPIGLSSDPLSVAGGLAPTHTGDSHSGSGDPASRHAAAWRARQSARHRRHLSLPSLGSSKPAPATAAPSTPAPAAYSGSGLAVASSAASPAGSSGSGGSGGTGGTPARSSQTSSSSSTPSSSSSSASSSGSGQSSGRDDQGDHRGGGGTHRDD